jgi:polar amino acid transport system substrate-binding protein
VTSAVCSGNAPLPEGNPVTVNRLGARRIPRTTVPVLAAGAALTLLAACDSSSATTDAAGPSGKPGAAVSTAIPTRDVVSGIRADPALKAELPAAVRARATLTLGTTLTPGVSGLPHGGQTASGQAIGLDVDLRNAIAKVLGISWKVENGTFPTIIPGVQNGRYDVGQDNFGIFDKWGVGGIGITDSQVNPPAAF